MCSENDTSADNQQERLYQSGWIVGFVDGEGCFSISIFKNSKTKFGWQIMPEFVVTQSEKSLNVLENMQRFFGCGKIFINRRYDNHKENLYRFCVRNRNDLTKIIIPFFKTYPLQTVKQDDFIQFCKIIDRLNNKEHFSFSGLKKIALDCGKKIN